MHTWKAFGCDQPFRFSYDSYASAKPTARSFAEP